MRGPSRDQEESSKMKKNSYRILSGVSVFLLGASAMIACGEDQIPSDGDGGNEGGSPALGGASGSGGAGGAGPITPGGAGIETAATIVLDNAINAYGATWSKDGHLYVSGVTDTGAANVNAAPAQLRLAVWRFTPELELDTSFGDEGKVTADEIVNPGTSYDVLELEDGSFVVQYSGSAGVFLVKLDVSGSTPSFGSPTKLEFGWPKGAVDVIDAKCSAAASAVSAKQAVVTTKEAAVKSAEEALSTACAGIGEGGAGAVDTCTSASDALKSAKTELTSAQAELTSALSGTEPVECVAAWPAARAPAFAERPTYASWGIALDKSQTEEKIVVFAHGPAAPEVPLRTDNDRWVGRVLASDLSWDSSFNGNTDVDGKKFFSLDLHGKKIADGARRGVVQEDGRIISSGYTDFGSGNVVNLIALKPDGSVDDSFGFTDDEEGFPRVDGLTHFNPFRADGGFAEAYNVARLSNGDWVSTGYGISHFDKATVENDLVTFRVLADGTGLDSLNWGGNQQDQKFGSYAVQSETDPGAGVGSRPYRENGRDVVSLADDRTIQVGCYDDFAAIFVLTDEGKLDTRVGAGTGRIQFAHPFPFFKAALSADGKRVVATASSRAKVVSGDKSMYARALLTVLDIDITE